MKISVLGAGTVGSALGSRLAELGHAVTYAVRRPDDPKYAELRASAKVESVVQANPGTEVTILATPWAATQAALESAGDLGGRTLLDATNPIGAGLTLTHGHTDSGAEQVQRWAPTARVVKVFNTTGVENMLDPHFDQAAAAMFVCGDDKPSCEIATGLARDLGFDTLHVGDLSQARLLEPVALLWIKLALQLGHGRQTAFSFMRR